MSEPAQAVGADQAIRVDMYRMMQEARRFEKRVHDLFLEGLVKGTSHLALGQEAVAAGYAAALGPGDLVYCTYRGHVHTLLRGAPMDGLMAELLGRATGICGGKGGSMHLTDAGRGAMGSYAIVGRSSKTHRCRRRGGELRGPYPRRRRGRDGFGRGHRHRA
jgi:acetoin:2,6-dichlorophenolindophenol oxidoreductase subunit alpha